MFRFEINSFIALRPKITYYGHSCFSVELNGKNILFDPFITPNPKASMIDISTIQPDFILVTHGHGDHIADLLAIAKQSKAQVISLYEITEWLLDQGIENSLPMDIGGSVNLGFCTVKMVKAEHSSSFPDGSYAGNAAGYVVQTSESSFYFAGDTASSIPIVKLSPIGRKAKSKLKVSGINCISKVSAVSPAK